MRKNIKIEHIGNPVYHYGMDDFEIAIRKENESLTALKYLIDNKLISKDYVRISKLFSTITKLKLISLLVLFHKLTKYLFLKNLAGKYPMLYVFDLYRLGYIAKLEKESRGLL